MKSYDLLSKSPFLPMCPCGPAVIQSVLTFTCFESPRYFAFCPFFFPILISRIGSLKTLMGLLPALELATVPDFPHRRAQRGVPCKLVIDLIHIRTGHGGILLFLFKET